MHYNSHHIIIHQIIIRRKHNVNMKTETEKITKKGGGGVGGVKSKGKGKGDCEITVKYRTLILWFISVSIIVLSCSQIYFFTPQPPGRSRHHQGRGDNTIIRKTTKAGTTSTISSISGIIAKRQDYGRNGISKKTTAKEQRVGIVDNNNNNDDVEAEILADQYSIPTNKVAKNSDGSINHKQIYKDRTSNYNKYLHQHPHNNGNAILLPDIEKELEETEVAIERKSIHNDDDNNDNDDEPWLVLHIGPPKTATTHIQCGLEKYSLRLAKEDKYHFLGGGCGVPEQEYVMPNSEETVLRRLLLIALHHRPPQKQQQNPNQQNPPPLQGNSKEYEKGLQHLQKTLSRMAYLRKRKRHVILSGEQFGSQLSKRKSIMSFVRSMLLDSPTTTGGGSTSSYGTNNNNNINNNNSTTTTFLASKIKITAGYKPNKIRIVLAYRHFVDWLPSYYYQNELILDNAMDEEWIVHGPSATGKNQKHRTQGHSGGRVQSFLKYADEYLTNWELHSNDVLQWIDTIQQKDVTTTTNSTTISSSEKPNRRKEMLLMLPDDRHSIHPSWWLYSLWSSYFPLKDQVQVYDMHSPMNMNLNVNNPNQDKNQDTMLTDFICHMLPTANKTCHKLWSLETNADTVTKIASPNDADDIVNYEEPYLHSSYSFLYPGRDDKKISIKVGGSSGGGGGGGIATSSDADTGSDSTTTETDSSSNKHSKQYLIVRKSSDHHSTRIVEELLVRGDIEYFTYENEDELRKYFEDENAYYEQQQQYYYDNEEENDRSNTDSTANKDDLAKKPFLKGLVKSELIELAETILTDNGVLVLPSSLSSSSISAVEQPAFSEKYFDCMSSQLEERLLNASSTFMDLMYKHTPMLSLATAATFPSTDDKNLIQKEKVKRWKQAKIEHARLFQKNKRKGKYCDINPDKVFQNNPKVYNILKALKFKPSYLRFKWNELPIKMKINAQLLGYDPRIWDLGKKAPLLKSTPTLWKDLRWNYKLSAFQLGYDIHRWNRIVTIIL